MERQAWKTFLPEDYTVGWISALPIELTAARAVLDEIHANLPVGFHDSNSYTLGSIASHNVVIACLPSGHYGTNNAAVVAANMKRSFPSIKVGLMVGIGGGVPGDSDIRLGDIVVGNDVIQFDFGKMVEGGQFQRTSKPVRPPHSIMTAVAKLRSEPTKIPLILSQRFEQHHNTNAFIHPGQQNDVLFEGSYEHDPSSNNCDGCDQFRIRARSRRPDNDPRVFYGLIASGNQVMRDGKARDYWARKKVLCFEMEAAGLVDHFPCLVIRGICDYADSHKNKLWQPYAAATAAAYAANLLYIMPLTRRNDAPIIVGSTSRAPPDSEQRELAALKKQRKSLLESLRFNQMESRHMTIKTAHMETCNWLLSHPSYVQWNDHSNLDKHYGFLWIKGKPGVGKSTLMKFLLQKKRENGVGPKNEVLLNFFFNARGEELERSALGMYRSLLLQLMTQIPRAQEVFDSIICSIWNAGQIGQPPDWTVAMLEDLFEKAIQKLQQLSVACFIDALDECDYREIRNMISFFERIGRLALSSGCMLHICLSSRHYPHITVKSGLQIIVEGQQGHAQDISNYIHDQLKIGHSQLAEDIRDEVQHKSSSVFMWVILVVDILNREYDDGYMHILQQRLQEIPSDLHRLFHDILTRDKHHRDELRLCLQWLLFSKTPLKPEELYCAILSGIDKSLNRWSPKPLNLDDVGRFILSSSKGLAEITTSKVPTVQFIHESIRDFLLKERGIRSIWHDLENLEGKGHEALKQCCLNYSRVSLPSYVDLDNPLLQPRGWLPWYLAMSFPFLKYSIQKLLYHADRAESLGVSQDGLYYGWDLQHWIKLHNLWNKSEKLDYTSNTRVLYILAEANASHLIERYPQILSCIEKGDEPYQYPLIAAITSESHESVRAFRNAISKDECLPSSIRSLFNRDFRQIRNRYELSKQYKLERQFGRTYTRSIFSCIAEYGDEAVFAFFMQDKHALLDVKDQGSDMTPLSWAAMKGHTAIVQMLLQNNQVDPNSFNYREMPPLWTVATSRFIEENHVEIMKLLIQHPIVDLDMTDLGDRTLLSRVADKGTQKAVSVLLNAGMNPHSRDKTGRTPVSWAASRPHHDSVQAIEVIKLLLEVGKVELDSKDDDCRTPFSWAAQFGCIDVLVFLSRTGKVEHDLKDNHGRTPLSWAAQQGELDVLKFLAQTNKVNLDMRDNMGRTPLSWADDSSGRYIENLDWEFCSVTRFLLATGKVDPNLKDYDGRTPLLWAAASGYWRKVSSLLAGGKTDADLQDNLGRTPLSWAAGNGHITTMYGLLETGKVDINSRDKSGRTPLSWAAGNGHSVEVSFLLGRFDILPNLADSSGRSPLSWASLNGKTSVVDLLLPNPAVNSRYYSKR